MPPDKQVAKQVAPKRFEFTWSLNIVSVINTATLVGILFTVSGYWFEVKGKIDGLLLFQASAQTETKELRARDDVMLGIVRELQERQNTRQAVTEIELRTLNNTIQRLESTVNRLDAALRVGNAGPRN